VYRKVIRSKKCSDAKNNIRDNIRTAYVKYGNIRKSKYTKTPYSNIRSMYLEHGNKYRLHRCERYVYKKPVLRKADTHTHTHTNIRLSVQSVAVNKVVLRGSRRP
jgi:hypothetical protein